MAELGVDIAGHRPTHAEELAAQPFDYVISLCGEADDDCPVVRGSRMVVFSLPDPCRRHRRHISGDGLDGFRHVRDAIRAMLVAWFGPEA
jgi:arsenate reductase